MSSDSFSDDDSFEYEFVGGSDVSPLQAGKLRKGNYAVLKGHPCKVVQINWSKTGKHGHAKVFIVGIDIFTEKKYEECVPSSFSISVPVVNLSEYQVLHIEEDGFLFLLGEDSETRGDIPLPINKELKARIQRCIEQDKQLSVTVLSALSQEGVISSKLL